MDQKLSFDKIVLFFCFSQKQQFYGVKTTIKQQKNCAQNEKNPSNF